MWRDVVFASESLNPLSWGGDERFYHVVSHEYTLPGNADFLKVRGKSLAYGYNTTSLAQGPAIELVVQNVLQIGSCIAMVEGNPRVSLGHTEQACKKMGLHIVGLYDIRLVFLKQDSHFAQHG
jgi:hypothetical protein